MSRSSNYRTWGQMNNEPDLKDGMAPGVKPKPKSTITVALQNENHLKFSLKKSRIVVVKAEADWCEPCKVLTPQYEASAKKSMTVKRYGENLEWNFLPAALASLISSSFLSFSPRLY